MELSQPIIHFVDEDGYPLQNGYIYVGTPDLDPSIPANQVQLFTDADLTIPVAQPIRTVNGMPAILGSPIRLFFDGKAVSLLVKNSSNAQMFYIPDTSTTGTPEVALLPTDLPAYGSAFGIDTSSTDNTSAFNSAISWSSTNKQVVYIPCGTYIVDGSVNLLDDCYLAGIGGSVVLLKKAGSSSVIVDGTNKERWTLDNFILDGNYLNTLDFTSNSADYINNSPTITGLKALNTSCIYANVTVRNVAGIGVHLTANSTTDHLSKIKVVTSGTGLDGVYLSDFVRPKVYLDIEFAGLKRSVDMANSFVYSTIVGDPYTGSSMAGVCGAFLKYLNEPTVEASIRYATSGFALNLYENKKAKLTVDTYSCHKQAYISTNNTGTLNLNVNGGVGQHNHAWAAPLDICPQMSGYSSQHTYNDQIYLAAGIAFTLNCNFTRDTGKWADKCDIGATGLVLNNTGAVVNFNSYNFNKELPEGEISYRYFIGNAILVKNFENGNLAADLNSCPSYAVVCTRARNSKIRIKSYNCWCSLKYTSKYRVVFVGSSDSSYSLQEDDLYSTANNIELDFNGGGIPIHFVRMPVGDSFKINGTAVADTPTINNNGNSIEKEGQFANYLYTYTDTNGFDLDPQLSKYIVDYTLETLKNPTDTVKQVCKFSNVLVVTKVQLVAATGGTIHIEPSSTMSVSYFGYWKNPTNKEARVTGLGSAIVYGAYPQYAVALPAFGTADPFGKTCSFKYKVWNAGSELSQDQEFIVQFGY